MGNWNKHGSGATLHICVRMCNFASFFLEKCQKLFTVQHRIEKKSITKMPFFAMIRYIAEAKEWQLHDCADRDWQQWNGRKIECEYVRVNEKHINLIKISQILKVKWLKAGNVNASEANSDHYAICSYLHSLNCFCLCMER